MPANPPRTVPMTRTIRLPNLERTLMKLKFGGKEVNF
jgi:hypothetical protein